MTATYNFSYYMGEAGLEALRTEWQQLYARIYNPCFCNDIRWHKALQRHLFNDSISYVAARLGTDLQAIIPLQQSTRSHAGLTVRYLHMPDHHVADLRDILLHQDTNCEALRPQLMHYLRHSLPISWQVLEWRDFTPRSGLYALLANYDKPFDICGYSNFVTSESEKNLKQSVSVKQIRNAERLLRKAETSTTASCQEVYQSEDIDVAYEVFLATEQAGWKGESGSAIALNPGKRAFYKDLANCFSNTKQVSIRILKLGEKAAACQLGLRDQKRLHLLKIGYDESLANLGPGSVIMAQCLAQEDERGTTEVNLVTSPSWAERWHFQREPKFDLLIYNHNLIGQIIKFGRQYRTRLKWKKNLQETVIA